MRERAFMYHLFKLKITRFSTFKPVRRLDEKFVWNSHVGTHHLRGHFCQLELSFSLDILQTNNPARGR